MDIPLHCRPRREYPSEQNSDTRQDKGPTRQTSQPEYLLQRKAVQYQYDTQHRSPSSQAAFNKEEWSGSVFGEILPLE